MSFWFAETLYPSWEQRFECTALIARETSRFQRIEVYKTVGHGNVLSLDGVVQICERDEFVYQEMLAHVPLLAHGAAVRVLIIGGGDGGVLRQVLLHKGVRDAVLVEIDEAVIRLSRQHLPTIGGDCWADGRATVVIGDGIDYLGTADSGQFDVVIVDSTDPAGVGEPLFSDDFYRDCSRVLGDSGILVSQGGVPFMQSDELRSSGARRRSAFAHSSAYVVAVPTYVGGLMALGIASNSPGFDLVPAGVLRQRAEAAGLDGTRYWSSDVQAASFALPPYIRELIE